LDIYSGIKLFDVGIAGAVGLLHLFLFAFYPRERANLCFSLFALGLAVNLFAGATAHSNLVLSIGGNYPAVVIDAEALKLAPQVFAAYWFLAFLYTAFSPRIPKYFWLVVVVRALLLAWQAVSPNDWTDTLADTLFGCFFIFESLRVIVQALVKHLSGAWIVGCGVLVIALIPAKAVLRATGLPLSTSGNVLIEQAGICGIIIAISAYLARNFAAVNKRLEAQLLQVKEFSRRELEHEQERARLLVVEAENERRAEELEEARGLQLSMLPKTVPQLPDLEIAAYMKPATEVGGDYYDFHIAEDGTLTVAVGDATGHGLKAGTMVTATKSLFNNLAHEADIAHIFAKSSAALKKMNLRGMFMAMTMMKIKDNRLTISCAGMPPVLLYHAATKSVEEIAIKAMPLGSPLCSSYQGRELTLGIGDAILLMSDGFPEMFNEQNEMLDYTKANSVLEEIAHASAQSIINRFVEVGEAWAGERAQDDDVTFVVVKVKDAEDRIT